jgi:ATP-dependent Clp protease adaptor protein ClpS
MASISFCVSALAGASTSRYDCPMPITLIHAADNTTAPRTRVAPKVARPPLYKVILVNDDFTPREFVVRVLKAEFRITGDQAHRIMITAHTKGSCVVAVFTRDVAETKATRATEMARSEGFPLLFSTEPEE